MMKKLLLLALAATILLASVASCSRRNQYEDQLDSQKEAASKDAAMDTGPVRGDGNDDYDVTMEIDTEAETKDAASDTIQDPPAAEPQSPTFYRGGTLLPTGKKYYVNSVAYFYNNLTGNISHWCSDPLCPHDDTCIWSSNLYAKLEYVSDKHIYFISDYGDMVPKLYRCDLQRNNIELLYELPGVAEDKATYYDHIEVVYEKGDKVYFVQSEYKSQGKSVTAFKVLDAVSKEITVLSGDKSVQIEAVVQDTVYYSLRGATSAEDTVIYKTDLSFANAEEAFRACTIRDYNNEYMLIEKYENGYGWTTLNPVYAYCMDTGTYIPLPTGDGAVNFKLSGDCVFFEKPLSAEEIQGSPLKDYYEYTWQTREEMPDGTVITSGIKNASTTRAGKIYRMKLGSEKIECVVSFAYKDIPVRIEDFEVDGDKVYFTFKNHEEFKNFYNQDFDEMGQYVLPHYAVADLKGQNVTILSFDGLD